jgi:hypothetical protein
VVEPGEHTASWGGGGGSGMGGGGAPGIGVVRGSWLCWPG